VGLYDLALLAVREFALELIFFRLISLEEGDEFANFVGQSAFLRCGDGCLFGLVVLRPSPHDSTVAEASEADQEPEGNDAAQNLTCPSKL
jgi:hypothetical protein